MLACIDEPLSTEVSSTGTCRFTAWALSASGRGVKVRASFGSVQKEFTSNRTRRDVLALWQAAYPEASDPCGFRFHLDLRGQESPLAITLEFDDGDIVARSPPFSVHLAPREAPVRADYKGVWNSVSGSADSAKLAVAGYTDEDKLRSAAEATVGALKESVGIRADDVVLEIGAGVGRVGALLAPMCKKWIGADVSENMVAHTRERLAAHSNVETIAVSGWDLAPIESASVDVVYCTVVFMHLDEWDRFSYISEGLRVLRPGGRMYVDNVNLLSDQGWTFFMSHIEDFHPLDRPPNISKTSTPDELRTYFERAGFVRIRQRSEGLWIATFGQKPRQGEL